MIVVANATATWLMSTKRSDPIKTGLSPSQQSALRRRFTRWTSCQTRRRTHRQHVFSLSSRRFCSSRRLQPVHLCRSRRAPPHLASLWRDVNLRLRGETVAFPSPLVPPSALRRSLAADLFSEKEQRGDQRAEVVTLCWVSWGSLAEST